MSSLSNLDSNAALYNVNTSDVMISLLDTGKVVLTLENNGDLVLGYCRSAVRLDLQVLY